MKDLFADILEIDDVQGVMFLSFDGKLLFKEFGSHPAEEIENKNWDSFISVLNGVREVEMIFENNRLYIKRAGSGYIVIVMGSFAPVAMVRLNCNIILPALDQIKKKPKGFGRFFRK